MDAEARIEAARARLEENRDILVRAKEAGPPCAQCIHFVPTSWLVQNNGSATPKPEGYCGHLAYVQPRYDPVTGVLTQTVEVPPSIARGPDGLCGFEGSLFERKPKTVIHYAKRAKEVALWSFIFLWASGLTWAAIIGGVRYLLG